MPVTQSCPILWDPMDWSPPGSSVHGILQARILEWVDIPFSRGSSWSRDRTWISLHCRQILYHVSHQGCPLTRSPKLNPSRLANKHTQRNLCFELRRDQLCLPVNSVPTALPGGLAWTVSSQIMKWNALYAAKEIWGVGSLFQPLKAYQMLVCGACSGRRRGQLRRVGSKRPCGPPGSGLGWAVDHHPAPWPLGCKSEVSCHLKN